MSKPLNLYLILGLTGVVIAAVLLTGLVYAKWWRPRRIAAAAAATHKNDNNNSDDAWDSNSWLLTPPKIKLAPLLPVAREPPLHRVDLVRRGGRVFVRPPPVLSSVREELK